MEEVLIKSFPGLPLDVAIKHEESINQITNMFLYLVISSSIASIVLIVSLYYLSLYSSFLLNIFAKQQTAYFVMQYTQLIEIQKSKILKGEEMGPFPCLNFIKNKIN